MNYEYITYISANVDQVWKYFSNKKEFASFQPAPLLNYDFKIDGVFQLGNENQTIMTGSFKKITELKSIHYTLEFTSISEPPPLVKVTLIPLGQMTGLHLMIENAQESSLEISKNQWPGMLAQLKTLLETGKGLPWPKS